MSPEKSAKGDIKFNVRNQRDEARKKEAPSLESLKETILELKKNLKEADKKQHDNLKNEEDTADLEENENEKLEHKDRTTRAKNKHRKTENDDDGEGKERERRERGRKISSFFPLLKLSSSLLVEEKRKKKKETFPKFFARYLVFSELRLVGKFERNGKVRLEKAGTAGLGGRE